MFILNINFAINCENKIKESGIDNKTNKPLKIRIKENLQEFIFLIITLALFLHLIMLFIIIKNNHDNIDELLNYSITKFKGNHFFLFLSLSAIFPFCIFFLTYIKKAFITYILLGFLVLFSILFNIHNDELNTIFQYGDKLILKHTFISKLIFSIITLICSIISIFYLGTNKFKTFQWIFLILGIPNLIWIFLCFLHRINILIKESSGSLVFSNNLI